MEKQAFTTAVLQAVCAWMDADEHMGEHAGLHACTRLQVHV